MNKIIVTLFLTFFFSLNTYADQLSYLTKEQAKQGVKSIRKLDYVYLYCGCCDGNDVGLVKITKVKYKFTNYENWYKVMLTYIDKNGVEKTEGIDLAYVWTNQNGKLQTIGEVLNFKHDPCKRLDGIKWEIE